MHKKESNRMVGNLILGLLDYWIANKKLYNEEISKDELDLYNECVRIAENLKNDSIVVDIDALKPNVDDRNFKLLAKSIRDNMEITLLEKIENFLRAFGTSRLLLLRANEDGFLIEG